MIDIEIKNPHCASLIFSIERVAKYRPPNSETSLFNEYELFLFKCDNENMEIISYKQAAIFKLLVPNGTVN